MATEKVGVYHNAQNRKKPWLVRWYTLVDPETSKRKRCGKTFRFKKDAERFARELGTEFEERGRPEANPNKQTLDAFLTRWLRRQRTELQPASLELYKGTARRLRDFFGKAKSLREITVESAQDFIAAQRNLGRWRHGEPLSPWTREQLKRHCKTIFDVAVESGYIVKNPFKVKALRSKKLPIKPWYRLNSAEYEALSDVTDSLREKTAYEIFYTAGLRLHEAFNLTWNCIDFQNNLLFVVNRDATPDVPPFSIKDHEQRRIPLPGHTIDLLTQLQTEAPEGVPFVLLTAERFERIKAHWQQVRKSGLPWKNRYVVNNVLRDFQRRVRQAGIKPIGSLTVHVLRKNCGQNWADHLPMNVVQRLMGHSSISTTARFYSTVDRTHEEKAAAAIQELLVRHGTDLAERQTDTKVTF